jgi:hypothetical protein
MRQPRSPLSKSALVTFQPGLFSKEIPILFANISLTHKSLEKSLNHPLSYFFLIPPNPLSFANLLRASEYSLLTRGNFFGSRPNLWKYSFGGSRILPGGSFIYLCLFYSFPLLYPFLLTRDYAAVLPTEVKNWFWEPLSPSLTSQTVLFSKPIFLVEGMIAQIWAKSQFSRDFGHTNPWATRC